MITRIDHVGVAVADLDAAKAFYAETFGLVTVHEEVNEQQGVREAMVAASPDAGRAGRSAAAARPRQRRVDDREVPRPVRTGPAPPRLDRRRHRVDERRAARPWPAAALRRAAPRHVGLTDQLRPPQGRRRASSSSSSSRLASGVGAASGRRDARTDRPRWSAGVRPPGRRRRSTTSSSTRRTYGSPTHRWRAPSTPTTSRLRHAREPFASRGGLEVVVELRDERDERPPVARPGVEVLVGGGPQRR